MSFKAEDIDIDAFLNLEGTYYSPSLANLNKGKGIVTPQFQQPPIVNINTYSPFQTSQTFSGPSRQYDLHKQHIPLPPGALANSLAATQNIFPFHGYQDYSLGSTNGFFGEEFINFNSVKEHRSSYGGSSDMDMDFDSSPDGIYIDPNSLGGHEEDDSPISARAEVVRVYPGMHAQQAQQAALAKQQQQNEIQRRQSLKATQRSQAQTVPKSSSSRGTAKAPVDPVVEERISRLLSQMRQTANESTEADTQAQSPPSSTSRSRKDEEDMDEDERLLASDEGKKLSSKERRQLRNKVSARAFRSRRKGQYSQHPFPIKHANEFLRIYWPTRRRSRSKSFRS